MNNSFPTKHLDPFQWADGHKILENDLDLKDFERLKTALGLNQKGKISYKLQFYRDEGGRALIKGKLYTTLLITCQRCLEPFNYLIDNDFLVAPLRKEKEADCLPKHIEPLIILDKALSLAPFIEDEVLLNLPVVAWHAPADCPQGQWHKGYATSSLASEELEDKLDSNDHPFAALKALKEQLAQENQDIATKNEE